MRRLLVMLTLLLSPSLALAKQPTARKVFPAELSADQAPPLRQARSKRQLRPTGGEPLFAPQVTFGRFRIEGAGPTR